MSFPGAIYVELQNKLDTSISIISWIYSSAAIGFIIATLIFGYIADHITEIHRLHALMVFVTSICIICIPLSKSSDPLIIIFIICSTIGIGFGINSLSYCLFIFRLYPINGGKMYFWIVLLVQISAWIATATIELSISYTNTFIYPFIGFAIIGISYSIIGIFLKTPQHDEYRSIKRSVSIQSVSNMDSPRDSPNPTPNAIDLDNLAQKAADHLKHSGKYKKLQNFTLILLMICMGCQWSI